MQQSAASIITVTPGHPRKHPALSFVSKNVDWILLQICSFLDFHGLGFRVLRRFSLFLLSCLHLEGEVRVVHSSLTPSPHTFPWHVSLYSTRQHFSILITCSNILNLPAAPFSAFPGFRICLQGWHYLILCIRECQCCQTNKLYLVIIHEVHGGLPQREEEGADSDRDDEVGDVGVGDILLWLCDPQ